MRLLIELFDACDLPDIIAELGLDFLQAFAISALLIIQQVKCGAKAASSWGRVAQDLHKSYKTKAYAICFARKCAIRSNCVKNLA